MVNKFLLSLGLICLCSMLIFGQDTNRPDAFKRPDFSGTWIPKAEKQALPDGDSDDWTKVVIDQSERAVKFTVVHPKNSKTPNKVFTFSTDESGETNEGTVYFFFIANTKPAEKEVKSVTKWEGNALVSVHKIVVNDTLATFKLDLIMRWELSPDGKTLNRTMKYSNYRALYKQKTAGGERLLELPVRSTSGNSEQEFQDSFVLFKTKK